MARFDPSGTADAGEIRLHNFNDFADHLTQAGVASNVIAGLDQNEFEAFSVTAAELATLKRSIDAETTAEQKIRVANRFQQQKILAETRSASASLRLATAVSPAAGAAVAAGTVAGTLPVAGAAAGARGAAMDSLRHGHLPGVSTVVGGAVAGTTPAATPAGSGSDDEEPTGTDKVESDIERGFEHLEEKFERGVGKAWRGMKLAMKGMKGVTLPVLGNIGDFLGGDDDEDEEGDDTPESGTDTERAAAEARELYYTGCVNIIIDHQTPHDKRPQRADIRVIYQDSTFRAQTLGSVRTMYAEMIRTGNAPPALAAISTINPSVLETALGLLGDPSSTSAKGLRSIYEGNQKRARAYAARKHLPDTDLPDNLKKNFDDLTVEELFLAVVRDMHMTDSLIETLREVDIPSLAMGGINTVTGHIDESMADKDGPMGEHAEKDLGITPNLTEFLKVAIGDTPVNASTRQRIQHVADERLSEAERKTLFEDILPFAEHIQTVLCTSQKFTLGRQGDFQKAFASKPLMLREALSLYVLTDGIDIRGDAGDDAKISELSGARKFAWYLYIGGILQVGHDTNSGLYMAAVSKTILGKAAELAGVASDMVSKYTGSSDVADTPIDPDVVEHAGKVMGAVGESAGEMLGKAADTMGSYLAGLLGIPASWLDTIGGGRVVTGTGAVALGL